MNKQVECYLIIMMPSMIFFYFFFRKTQKTHKYLHFYQIFPYSHHSLLQYPSKKKISFSHKIQFLFIQGPYLNFHEQQQMFQTQIIKLTSLKSSLNSLFQSLTSKCQTSKDYDVTVIVKESAQTCSSGQVQQDMRLQAKKSNTVGFNDNLMILNQDISESYISLDQKISSRHSLKSNMTVQVNPAPKMAKIRFKKKEEKENSPLPQIQEQRKTAKNSIYTQTENNAELNIANHSQLRLQDSAAQSQRYSCKINNLQMDTENSDDDSQEGDGSDGGFLIQNYLNQALEFIEQNRMQQLEDFLYKFKEKHNFINVRAETKWSLLMGYCKQTKMEFERAATNYSQVICKLTQNPLMLAIEIADIYCRLGRCYFENGEWNKAITAYSHSLNKYKKNKKCLQYANCITNLGVLYLQIGYFIQAERCFLMAFNIKRAEGDKKSRVNLLQTYLHLFDCNLKLKNLMQCEQILGNVSTIIEEWQNSVQPIIKIRYYIKCGKLLFFQGKFQLAQNHYHYALNIIKKGNSNMQEHAEVLELIGVLKQETGEPQRSKFYLEKAFHYLQKCLPIGSPKLELFKKKIQGMPSND